MTLTELYRTVQGRKRPEDVAEMCRVILGGELAPPERMILLKAARGSLKSAFSWGYSSMASDFARPVGFAVGLEEARRLFPAVAPPQGEELDDSARVEIYLRALNAALGKTFGENDFAGARLSHTARRDIGLEVSRRRYNKMFRCVAHLEAKLAVLRREERKYEFTRISKTKLATHISPEEFERDARSACFIAYYAARCNLRSRFTNTSQERPFDEICALLLEKCRGRESTNWGAIAYVFPDAEVLEHLSPAQKGELLGRWFAALGDIGALLREVWESSDFARDTMIVQRGNDSTTWNNTAAAWNKARDSWLALLKALGLEAILDTVCLGKVPRLMAADVAYWHHISGGGLHPDTALWAALPLPWEVLQGGALCSRALVEKTAAKLNIDAQKAGWTQPRPRGAVAAFRPTPELVHGVEVSNPIFAKILRDAGAFSGKTKNPQNSAQNAALN